MKVHELRIGNKLEEGEVVAISKTNFSINDGYSTWRSDMMVNDWGNPIPLTEETLLKCGFNRLGSIKNVHRKITDGKTMYLYKYGDDFDWQFGDHHLCTLKHLHQLQNIYFALTGEELNIQL